MARRRYISTDISVDKRIAKLAENGGDFAALLYTWMIPHALDDGSITADPEELRLMVVPGFKKKTEALQKAVTHMLDLGLLEYNEGSDRLLFPKEPFYKYQTYINAANRRKDITSDVRIKTPENTEERRETPRNAASPPPPPSLSLSPSPSVVVLDARADEVGCIVAEFANYGTVNALTVGYVEEAVESYTADWVKRAVKVGAKGSAGSDSPPWNYIESILKRWRVAGEPDDDKAPPEKRGNTNGRQAEPTRASVFEGIGN